MPCRQPTGPLDCILPLSSGTSRPSTIMWMCRRPLGSAKGGAFRCQSWPWPYSAIWPRAGYGVGKHQPGFTACQGHTGRMLHFHLLLQGPAQEHRCRSGSVHASTCGRHGDAALCSKQASPVQGDQASSNMEGNHSFFIFTIKMRRDYRHDVISLFIPSWLIWILAYFTFYIDLKNFNNRFMGSVTSLLVLASLLNSMQSKLPKTSYFKFVDFWFLWYIINSIIMIGAHVLIVNVNETELSASTPLAWPGNKNDISKDQMRRRKRANKIAKLIFPLLTIPFNLFYFMMHLI